MKQSEFFSALTEAFPDLIIFRGVIQVDEGEELPPKYLYFVTGETLSLEADNVVYWEETPVTLYVVEDIPEEELTENVKTFLNSNRLPYRATEAEWNDDVSAWLTTFNFTI